MMPLYKLLERYSGYQKRIKADFLSHVDKLMEDELVLRLDSQLQHYKFTRLRHSFNVAYRSYYLSRLLRWKNSEAVARAGLLHDLFFHEAGQGPLSLLLSHPEIAVKNAGLICRLSPLEEDIIRGHMCLFNFKFPSCKEGYLVVLMDNYSTIQEFAASLLTRRKIVPLYPARLQAAAPAVAHVQA